MRWRIVCMWLGAAALFGCSDDGDNQGGGQSAGNVLEISGSSEQCIACMEDKCGSEVRACNSDRDCVDVVICIANCHEAQAQCSTQCSEDFSCADVDSEECNQRQECLQGCNTFSTDCPNDCDRDHPRGGDKELDVNICWSDKCTSDCPGGW